MIPWLTSKVLGVPRWGIVVGAAALLVLGYFWLASREEADDNRNQEIGRTIEREEATRTVLERTEAGNAARDEIRAATLP